MSRRLNRWRISILTIGLAIAVLGGVIAYRTATFTSKQIAVSSKISYPIDVDQAAQRLSKAIAFQTVSVVSEGASVDYEPFMRFQEYLKQSFPLVHSTLDVKTINEHALLFIWKGSETSLKPILLMGHYDVMPATDEGWKYPPFAGTIADGYVWGRGALDDKGSAVSILEAAEYLLKDGYSPKRSIYLAFGYDEENKGHLGAEKLAAYLKSQGLQFECVMDEGLYTTQGVFPGLPASTWIDLVGTQEKGFVDLRLTAQAEAGHSSMPPRQTAVGIVAAAIDKLESNPFPVRWINPTTDTFDYLGREASLPYKVIFANMWLFRPLIEGQITASPKSNAVIRTTTAPTVFNAGQQASAMPASATAIVNFRLMPGETVQDVVNHAKAVINDPRVQVELVPDHAFAAPSSQPSIDSWSFETLSKTIREVMPDVLVTPSLVTGFTDERYYAAAELSSNLFRTLPVRVPPNDLTTPHGLNERIAINAYGEMITYYIQLMRNFGSIN